MKVKRIVANIDGTDFKQAKEFYQGIFGLELLMDLGWINTFGSDEPTTVQLSVASEGGSGTPVPDLSIEVDNLDAVIDRVKENRLEFEYGPVTEPWGLRRFYIRDPFGKLINVLQHE